jgi:hypothetical protein
MKKRIRILLLVLLVAILGGLAFLVFTVRGPGELDPKLNEIMRSSMTPDERRAAFSQMGTNIIPSLRIMIRRYDSPLKLKLTPLAYKLRLAKPPAHTPDEWHWDAGQICSLLDNSVRTQLVEDWIYLIDHGNAQDRVDAFIAERGGVGPEALQPLLKALNDRNPRVREFAASALKMPDQAAVIVPALLPKLNDPDEIVRGVSLLTLVWLRPDPDTAEKIVPLITAALNDPSSFVRQDACNALRSLAPFSKPAVPALVRLLQDSDPNVRKLAADALMLIDNEAAQKAGIK